MRVFVVGTPHHVGGAGPHCWHTVKLWRANGVDVTFIATNTVDAPWRNAIEALGCTVNYQLMGNSYRAAREIEYLPGQIVVSFCNGGFLRFASRLRLLGCKLVWLGCMNWLHTAEKEHYKKWGPFDRYVCQSGYQRFSIEEELYYYNYKPHQLVQIPSPIDVDEFPFTPLSHSPNEPFVMGRVSRADISKYTKNMWEIYGSVRGNIKVRVMAWDDEIRHFCGDPPKWAECLSKSQESPREFLGKLHCMIQIGRIRENRPRSCLEAMACGVPVIAPAEGGWKELIRHGHNGFLCNDPAELAYLAGLLAKNESLRLEIVGNARRVLSTEIANPQVIWSLWQNLFSELLNGQA